MRFWAAALVFVAGLLAGGLGVYQWQSARAEKAAQAVVEAQRARDVARTRADSLRAAWEAERASSGARKDSLEAARARADSALQAATERRRPAVQVSDASFAELRREIRIRAPELEPLARTVETAWQAERAAREEELVAERQARTIADSTNAMLERRERALEAALASTFAELEAERELSRRWETAYNRATRTGLTLPGLGLRIPHEVGYVAAAGLAGWIGYEIGSN